jgi:O-antigen ligase
MTWRLATAEPLAGRHAASGGPAWFKSPATWSSRVTAEHKAAAAIVLASAFVAILPEAPRIATGALLVGLPLALWMVANPLAWLAVFLAAVLLLPPLPADIGNTGAHPSLAAAALGVLAGAFHANRWARGPDAIGRGLVALATVMLASVAFALVYSGFSVAFGSLARVLLFAITAWVFLYVRCGPGRTLGENGFGFVRALFACGVISAAFACVDFYLQLPPPAGYSPQFIWLDDRVLRRAQGVFYDAGAIGNLCAFFLVMAALCVLSRERTPVSRRLAVLGAVPLAGAIVFSYSRAALLNLAVALVALLAVRRGSVKWFRAAAAFALGIATVALVASWLAPDLAWAWGQRLQRTIELSSAAGDVAVSGRFSTWQAIAAFIMDHPVRVLFGVGYKSLAYSDVLGSTVIADNTWLSTLLETGIAGVVCLAVLSAAILRVTFRAARSTDERAAFYGAWAFAFWVGEMVQMFTADLLTWWRILPVVFFVIAMAALRTEVAAGEVARP